MIFDYYCVNCGNKMHGNEINFDLSELLGIRNRAEAPDRLAMVNAGVLQGNAQAKHSGQPLIHGKRSRVRIPLKIYLGILGRNNDGRNGIGVKEMQEFSYGELRSALQEVYRSTENKEAAASEIEHVVSTIRNRFVYDGPNDQAARQKTENYYATTYIKPTYFDDGKSNVIDTVEYSLDENSPNTTKLGYPEQIRGYCPKCGKPILNGTGRYPHVMVGILGTQSAGKTTLIQSLLREVTRSSKTFGIRMTNKILCDDRYAAVQRDKNLFERGWPPMKTAASGANAYNASMLLESAVNHRMMVVTFADIAGEQCYDTNTGDINFDALNNFPLINSCDVYLLCSCIDRTQYGNGEDQDLYLPPEAILNIANGIYQNLRDPRKVPPLGIVLTKADVAGQDSAFANVENPFTNIKPLPAYNYKTQFDNLNMLYNMVGNDDIREPLEWCCTTFDELKDLTYMAMFSCSALGRSADMYKGDISSIPMSPRKGFTPSGVDVILKWVLQCMGLTSVDGQYFFPHVPSYQERYTKTPLPGVYMDKIALNRSRAIPKMFINPSPDDAAIGRAPSNTPAPTRRGQAPVDPVAAVIASRDLYVQA